LRIEDGVGGSEGKKEKENDKKEEGTGETNEALTAIGMVLVIVVSVEILICKGNVFWNGRDLVCTS
jgi:hypothetical protein